MEFREEKSHIHYHLLLQWFGCIIKYQSFLILSQIFTFIFEHSFDNCLHFYYFLHEKFLFDLLRLIYYSKILIKSMNTQSNHYFQSIDGSQL